MTEHPIKDLSIRSGVVWQPDTGYVLACDPELEEEKPHAKLFRWHRGDFAETWVSFNAHSICRITVPEPALVFLSGQGFYAVNSQAMKTGNIFNNSRPEPKQPRYGSIRSVATIGGKAYAVGLRGMAYRLDELTAWTRIDDTLAPTFDAQAIDGFDAAHIYAVGSRGEICQFDGRQQWTKRDSPTNLNLACVKCAGDETVYVGGHQGMLIRGREGNWITIEHEQTTKDIWDLEWFEGELYASTMSAVYRLKGDVLEPVDFGDDPPKTCYHLSAANGVLWSIGGNDIMSYNGNTWTRIV